LKYILVKYNRLCIDNVAAIVCMDHKEIESGFMVLIRLAQLSAPWRVSWASDNSSTRTLLRKVRQTSTSS
jgi:hypothetical protein